MKKQLLSIGLVCSAFLASAQVFIGSTYGTFESPTFTAGNLGTQGSWGTDIAVGLPASSISIVSAGSPASNVLQITGPANGTDYAVAYRSFPWASRTAGNEVLYTYFKFNTGAAANSKTDFVFDIEDANSKTLIGFSYSKDTRLAEGLIYDSTASAKGVYSVPLGANNAALNLTDNTLYYVFLTYDLANGLASFTCLDAALTSYVFNVSDVAFETIRLPKWVTAAAYANTGNTVAATAWYDNIVVKARPCADYDTKVAAGFSYTGSMCKGAVNLNPVLVTTSSTGVFSSSSSNLVIDPLSGIVNMGTSTPGTYTVKYVTDDPYVANTVAGSCPDSVTQTITILNCAGIEEVIENKFSIYPNPTNDVVTVSLSDLVITEGTIKLTSADGKLIEAREFNNSSVETFDVKSLKAGIYFFQIGNTTEKVVIK